MSMRGTIFVAILVVLGALMSSVLYRVHERETAIVLEFGDLKKANIEPGLGFKLPKRFEPKF